MGFITANEGSAAAVAAQREQELEKQGLGNFEALVKSPTVGEALAAMKALSPGGNSVDIRLAIEKGCIQLGE